jgi:hypothetical protein
LCERKAECAFRKKTLTRDKGKEGEEEDIITMSTTINAKEDASILLPEIEVSDLVDAIPIDIVGELFEEEEEEDDDVSRGRGRVGGGMNAANFNKTSSKIRTPTDGLNIIQPRPPFKTDSFNRGSQQQHHRGGGLAGSSGGPSSNGNSLGGGGGSFPSIPPVYSMTSPGGRRNSTEHFPSTVGFALKGGSTSSSTDAFALTSDVDAILNGGKPFVPSAAGAISASELAKSTATITPVVQGPSGPRMPGQGVEEQEQVVVSTETDENGGVRVRVTLLAAGFVIGNAGASVREITQHTGASIRSWTQPAEYFFGGFARPTRVFCVEGDPAAIAEATELIYAAVDRYRALCEMKKRGEFVQRSQKIKGVEFSFQPPPRQITQRQRQLEQLLSAQTHLLQHQTNALSGAAAGSSAVALQQAFAQQHLLMQQQIGFLNQQMSQQQQQGYFHHHQQQQYQQQQHYHHHHHHHQQQQQQQQQQHNMFGSNQNYY